MGLHIWWLPLLCLGLAVAKLPEEVSSRLDEYWHLYKVKTQPRRALNCISFRSGFYV